MALLSWQHDALRELLDELPASVLDDGVGDRELARAVRATLGLELCWHHADEETVLLPRLVGFSSALDEMCASCRAHHRTVEAAALDVADLARAICLEGFADPVDWREACEALRLVLEPAMAFEDEALWPVARRVLERDDREDIAATLRARAEGRPEHAELLGPKAASSTS